MERKAGLEDGVKGLRRDQEKENEDPAGMSHMDHSYLWNKASEHPAHQSTIEPMHVGKGWVWTKER